MKNNPTGVILNWALGIGLILLFVGGVQYFFRTKEMRSLQTKVGSFQNRQVIVNSLVSDVMEYSKRNPAIDPVLESIGLKPTKSASTGATKPATK